MNRSLIKESGRQTPFYAYDISALKKTINRADAAANKHGFHIHYALKANSTEPVVREMLHAGFGVDCVSGQEMELALAQGFEPSQIAFAGVGKTDWEIDNAIKSGIFTLNVESIEELLVIDERAEALGIQANIALRINPDVNARTHHYITTGLEENKFGISSWMFDRLFETLGHCKHVSFKGLHFHIGSQIRDLEPFKNLCTRINHIQSVFIDHGYFPSHINAGGGLGVDYDDPDSDNNPDFDAFFDLFETFLDLHPSQTLHFELGRSLVANCGDLISKIVFVKEGQKTNFLILDAGMTELIRPALYQAFHKIENIEADSDPSFSYDVVGPICESSDCFGKAVMLPESRRGQLVAIRSAGAYGECMANRYNMRTLNPSMFY
jgi:diaminopimelate decarboxylase